MSSPFVRVSPNNAPPLTLRAFQRPVGTSFLLHSGLATGTWILALTTNRLDFKDWLWPAAPVANAWYQAIGIPVYSHGLPIGVALKGLSWRQSLLLGGVTTWGLRLLYQVATTSTKRGRDDPRYTKEKLEPSFWGKSLVTQFLPEAVFQTLISLPFTAPFRSTRISLDTWGWTDTAAVSIFTMGLALEWLADSQKDTAKKVGKKGLYRDGVWSIVRHPNYLGDALTHLSFALLAYNTPSFHPALFVGPLANYVFLRFVGGDKQNEAGQTERYDSFDPVKGAQLVEYQREKNAFWPALSEFGNVWTLAVLGAGVVGVVVEKTVRELVKPVLL